MAETFTPGPWKIELEFGPYPNWIKVFTEDRKLIGKILRGDSTTELQSRPTYSTQPSGNSADANARLIAAAPDLYGALKRIMNGFDDGVWVRSTKDDDDPLWALKIISHIQALGAAMAAIQKVEGQ